jgi:hypothetical protein
METIEEYKCDNKRKPSINAAIIILQRAVLVADYNLRSAPDTEKNSHRIEKEELLNALRLLEAAQC